MKQYKRHITMILAVLLLLPVVLSARATDITLTITGDGVDQETVFTLAELTSMAISQDAYTALNTWPTKSAYYAQGVAIATLLEKAGLKDAATTINFAEAPAADGVAGYNMTFLLDDLLADRYTFEDAKKTVPAIIATKMGDKSIDSMDEIDLRLIYGQLDAQEQTSAGFVKSVRVITVTCGPVRRHPKPEVSAERLASGQYSVELKSSNVNAKIYYTTDGSEPSVHSTMYNISAPHWQPHLNAPFIVGGSALVRAIAVATGFADSEILSFTPASITGETPPADPGMANFVKTGSYKTGQFRDVDEKQWYGPAVESVFEYGLMRGPGDTSFNPSGDITIGEAVTLAARVYSVYSTGNYNPAPIDTTPWYQANVDYAVANGIIGADDFTDFSRAATRAEVIYIFSRALPQSEYPEQNTVHSLPDVGSGTPFADSIFALYKAGVLTGNDAQGTFYPYRSMSRAETAAIIIRVILTETRASGRTYLSR